MREHVVVLYVISSIDISTDKYIHSILVYVRVYIVCGNLIVNVDNRRIWKNEFTTIQTMFLQP